MQSGFFNKSNSIDLAANGFLSDIINDANDPEKVKEHWAKLFNSDNKLEIAAVTEALEKMVGKLIDDINKLLQRIHTGFKLGKTIKKTQKIVDQYCAHLQNEQKVHCPNEIINLTPKQRESFNGLFNQNQELMITAKKYNNIVKKMVEVARNPQLEAQLTPRPGRRCAIL